ncbi:vacuolar membrane-associated protein iml1 [Sporothrix curviconia]|uniref:Vacuolar membrane-associated protein IML1 n=1 Tax=Sporothrix curviconia TaxID=1260050 RepID=A0ABP0AX65_9PEZI
MSRNGFSPAHSRKTGPPRWASHLRQFSRTSSDTGPVEAASGGPSQAPHPPHLPPHHHQQQQQQQQHGQHHPHPHHHHPQHSSSTPPRAHSPDTMSSNSTIREANSAKAALPVFERTCTVTVNESFARDEVLMNLDHFDDGVQPGQLMAIDVLPDQRPGQSVANTGGGTNAAITNTNITAGESGDSTRPPGRDSGRRYLFIVKDMPKELKLRHPTVEIFVAKRVADAFGMKKGSTVLLTLVDASNPAIEASHVELVFKDQYLSRADMWRLAVSELSERTIYRGQMVLFMSTIKAQVTHVFVEGKRVQSAFFGKNTRPIFRSESARFVLFIQMAREMWDFDSDCSGEILFSKVVNGLLPTLFKKWAARKVKHLVTIVLFARVEYDTGLTVDLSEASEQHEYYTGVQSSGSRRPYKDFYRVVVSEMSSGEWTRILYQLKREFNLFRRDISLHHLTHLRPDTGSGSGVNTPFGQKQHHIQAESSPAMYGNVLEAVNMASTLFAHDYVDRDLMRTGISVVIISPGSGVFEVEYDSLRRTTEALIGNGIGIDMICIPKVPLHYAPLFRFRHPNHLERGDYGKTRTYSTNSQGNTSSAGGNSHGTPIHRSAVLGSTPKQQHGTPLYGSSYSSIGAGGHSLSPSRATATSTHTGETPQQQRAIDAMGADRQTDSWLYALPQWLHVSYWASEPNELLMRQGVPLPPLVLEGTRPGKHLEEFAVRCRMYDLQMRGVLETNEIETTPLYADPLFPRSAFRATANSLVSAPAELNGILAIQNKMAANILFDQVYGFQKFAADKLAKQSNRSLWKHLQEYDATRQKLPTRRRAAQQSGGGMSVRRELDSGTAATGSSSALALAGPSTLRKQHYLGSIGAGTESSFTLSSSTATATTVTDRRASTASVMSTATITPSNSSSASAVAGPQSKQCPAALLPAPHPTTTADHRAQLRDNTRSVSFDKESIKSSRSSSSKMPKAMRQISLGQRGFGIAAPKVAVAEVSVETVAASRVPSATPSLQLSIATATASTSSASAMGHGALPSTPKAGAVYSGGYDRMHSPLASADRGAGSYRPGSALGAGARTIGGGGSTADLRGRGLLAPDIPSRPIVIRAGDSSTNLASRSFLGAGLAGRADVAHPHEDRDLRYSNALRADDAQRVYNSKLRAEAVPEVPKALSPTAAMAPWLMMINPSKPEANKIDSVTFNSRWQHVFPRPGEIRVMRWKTLCSPASVPLTTEYFPSKAQFESEYQQQPYSVSQEAEEDLLSEVPQTRDNLLRELISLRLSQGFQVVIGPVVAKAFGQKQMKIADIFSTSTGQPFEDGTSIFMSIGNTIHQLSFANSSEVQVNIYQRKTDELYRNSSVINSASAAMLSTPKAPLYRPAIRTLLDRDYQTTEIDISAPRTERNWNYIDSYLAGHDEQLTENLRFWRARFVLIPMVLPTHRTGSVASTTTGGGGGGGGTAGPATANNPVDNDEEVRLEGIRKLGQLWQKHRVVPASERHFMQTLANSRHRRARDTNQNPLDVVYKTDDPSVVIAAELESTLSLLGGGGQGGPGIAPRKGQLVTNRDPFRKGSLNLAALAEAIQQPVEQGGVRMQNRRWHLRLHYNCFIGSDMTSWLLDNVEDLESRQEAEALGNMLMVSDRDRDHFFKDKDATAGDASEKGGGDRKERNGSGSILGQGGTAGDNGNVGGPSSTANATGGGGGGNNAATGGTAGPGANTTAASTKDTRNQGLFVHVEKRHAFRDGQYFYQISSEYAKPHNSGGWFNTRKASVAAVPSVTDLQSMGGTSGNGPTALAASRPAASRPTSIHEGSDIGRVPPSAASTPIMSAVQGGGGAGNAGGNTNNNSNSNSSGSNTKKPRVVLSKMMKYDVDHRRRSYRPERIDLHYDRLHNPDNCYHIRIEWMNVTAKLIEDAVEVWAREAFQHGLRLVEVPIAEASVITEGNPFRRPYKVRLAIEPPAQRPATYFDASSLAPQAAPGHHFYQKAILRKFGFVLDTEAASNFPASVDVQYSWGRPHFKYSQYIHRSGIILAQIDDDGAFLLLVNRLYSNRSVASTMRDNMRQNDQQQQQQQAQAGNSNSSEPSVLQSPMGKSLYHSPRLRPAGLEGLSQKGSSATMSGLLNKNTGPGPIPIVSGSSSVPVISANHNASGVFGQIPSTASAVLFSMSTIGLSAGEDPESVMDELEVFSQDPVALAAFYAEVLEKRTAATANTLPSGAATGGTANNANNNSTYVPHPHHIFLPPGGPRSRTTVGTPSSTGRPVSNNNSSNSIVHTPSSLSSLSSATAAAAAAAAAPPTADVAAAQATAEVPDTNIPALGLPPGLLNSSTRHSSGGSGLLGGGGGGDSPAAPSSDSSSLRSPTNTTHSPSHSQSQLMPPPAPLTPVRTTSPGFLASRMFLRRSSVDDIGLQRPPAGGRGSPGLPPGGGQQ